MDDSPARGQTILDRGVPRDATIVAIIRAGHVVVPRGDTRLQAGDEVLALTTPSAEEAVRMIFIAEGAAPPD